MNRYEFEEEQKSPEQIKVEGAIVKAMSHIDKLIIEAKNNVLYGQYEVYIKNFAFVKFLITKLNEMQNLYENLINPSPESPNTRFSDVEDKINEILSNIVEYNITETETITGVKKVNNGGINSNLDINW
jgi:hypothetical protein